MSWDNARRHARALETALDAKLASYSRIASAIARGPGGSSTDDGPGGYKLVEEEIEELLAKVSNLHFSCSFSPDPQLEQAIDDLTTLINSPSQPPSTSMQHAAQRHRDNLDDYRRDFLRARVSSAWGEVLIARTMWIKPSSAPICSDPFAKKSGWYFVNAEG